MPRYIEDTEALRVLSEYYHHRTDLQKYALAEAISQVPTANVVEAKHGKWLWLDGARCSNCNHKLQTTGLPSYCPNCGAKMDEKDQTTHSNALNTLNALDCISQQAEIISTVEKVSEVRYPVFYAEKNAKKIRQLSPAQPEQRWIPVTEDKPRKRSNILVTDFNTVVEAYYASDGNWFDLLGTELKGVTAWMPTPKPYRKEIEDE